MNLKKSYYQLLIKEKTDSYIKFLHKARNLLNYFLQFFVWLVSVRKVQKLLFSNFWLIENLLVSFLATFKTFKLLQGQKISFHKNCSNVLHCGPDRVKVATSYFRKHL
jgi:hypothetical protein